LVAPFINRIMTQREMFEKSFQRPSNYFKLSAQRQWEIDDDLGILDWEGQHGDEVYSDEDILRFKNHYDMPRGKPLAQYKEENGYTDI